MWMWNDNHQEEGTEVCERMEDVGGKIVQTVGTKIENEGSDKWDEWKGVGWERDLSFVRFEKMSGGRDGRELLLRLEMK